MLRNWVSVLSFGSRACMQLMDMVWDIVYFPATVATVRSRFVYFKRSPQPTGTLLMPCWASQFGA